MIRRLLALSFVLACAIPAYAGNEANSLVTGAGGTPLLKTAVASENGVDEDLVIAAVAGKRITVVGFSLFNTTAVAGVFGFNCAVGGTNMWSSHLTATVGFTVRESAEAGGFLFRCASGVGVAADNDLASGAVKMNLRYVLED